MMSFLVNCFIFASVLIDCKYCLSPFNLGPSSNGGMEKPRILGGTEAKGGQYPFIISLHARRTNPKTNETTLAHDCGGAIASEDNVVTAAHCVWNKAAKDLLVVAGAHSIKVEEPSQQRVKVAKIILHPKYTAQDAAGPYDIAILKLKKKLSFNERVNKTDLAQKNEVAPPGKTCYNAGWGNQFPVSTMHYKGSDSLTTGKTKMISASDCKQAYPVYSKELETAICARAGFAHGTCQGDSGGPLTCTRNDSQPYLAGLVSFGFKVCNNGYHPDVYTDMGHPAIFNFVDLFLKTGLINETILDEKKTTNVDANSKRSSADNKLPLNPSESALPSISGLI